MKRLLPLFATLLLAAEVTAATPKTGSSTPERTTASSLSSAGRLGFKFSDTGFETIGALGAQLPGRTLETSGATVVMPVLRVKARSSVLLEREVLSESGQVEFAKKKFTTPLYRATFGPLAQVASYYFNFLSILGGWHPNDAEAMALYRESERGRMLSEFDDLARLEELGDPRTGGEFRRMRFGVRQTGVDALYGDPFGRRH